MDKHRHRPNPTPFILPSIFKVTCFGGTLPWYVCKFDSSSPSPVGLIWDGFQAILAALGALPRQSLVDILRQMVEQLQKLMTFFCHWKIYQRCPSLQRVVCLRLSLQFLKSEAIFLYFHPIIFCCQQETGGTTPGGGCNGLWCREHLSGEDLWLPRQPNGMQVWYAVHVA